MAHTVDIWYVKEDITGMTLKQIQELMRKVFGLDMQHLYHVHFSPDCSMYSAAIQPHTYKTCTMLAGVQQ